MKKLVLVMLFSFFGIIASNCNAKQEALGIDVAAMDTVDAMDTFVKMELGEKDAAVVQSFLALQNNSDYEAMRIKLLLEQHRLMKEMQGAFGNKKEKAPKAESAEEFVAAIKEGFMLAPKIALKWGIGLPTGVLGAVAVGRATVWVLIKTGAVGWAMKTFAGMTTDLALEACDVALFDKGLCSGVVGWFGSK